jgi:predicted ATPase
LGHFISYHGVAIYSEKISFIHPYSIIAQPLTHMLKKDSLRWTLEEEQAFKELKRSITSRLGLTLLDFSQTFTIECDASGVGLGIMLK